MELILDLRCGVSGDMLLGALIDWLEREKGDISTVIDRISRAASAQSPTELSLRNVERGGHRSKRLFVNWKVMEGHATTGRDMMDHLNSGMNLTGMNSRVKKLATRILMNILESEAAVHNESDVYSVHLHEAGTPDTLVDVIGIALVSDMLEVDGYWVKATPVSLGSGSIATEHGVLDIPVPAVRHMLRSIPGRSGPVTGELATPTGMAAVMSMVDLWMSDDDLRTLPGFPAGRGAGEREYDDFPNILTIYTEVE